MAEESTNDIVVTRCPHCGAAFRARRATLRKSQGWALCGECFEAFEALPAEPSTPPSPPPQVFRPRATSVGDSVFAPRDEALVPSALPETEPSKVLPTNAPAAPSLENHLDAETTSTLTQPPDTSSATAQSLAEARTRPSAQTSVPDEPSGNREGNARLGATAVSFDPGAASIPPPPVRLRTASESRSHPLAAFLAIVLFALLMASAAVQAVVVWHKDLIRLYPPTLSWLKKACQHLDCVVTPPEDVRHLAVDDMRLIKEPSPGLYTLELTLINRAEYPQAWPHLSLTLQDALGRPLARRLLAPQELGAHPDAVLPARHRQPLAIVLETFEQGVAGFEVRPYYP